MYFKNSQLVLLAIASATFITACGGGGGNGVPSVSEPIAQEVPASGVMAFINDLIGNTSDDASPIDVSAMTLNEDDSAEPTVVP